MFENYPDIIRALIAEAETDRLRYFELSFFMTGPSLKEVYGKIDKTMRFFTVYVYMERLEDDLWDNDRYTEKEKVILCSRVEEEVRKYWWDRNREHIKLIDERLDSLKNEPEYKKMKVDDLRDKIIKDLDQEIYPEMIERVKEIQKAILLFRDS